MEEGRERDGRVVGCRDAGVGLGDVLRLGGGEGGTGETGDERFDETGSFFVGSSHDCSGLWLVIGWLADRLRGVEIRL